VISWGTIRIS